MVLNTACSKGGVDGDGEDYRGGGGGGEEDGSGGSATEVNLGLTRSMRLASPYVRLIKQKHNKHLILC